jgi:hypothetical protein
MPSPYPVMMNILNVYAPCPPPREIVPGQPARRPLRLQTEPSAQTVPEHPPVRRLDNPPQFSPDEEDKHPAAAKDDEDESLSEVKESKTCKALFKGNSYKYRNIYKSIMRNMYICLRKNREELSDILTRRGFTMANIEHAYYKIDSYHDSERKKGKKKVAQSLIQKMLTKDTIYTHVLQETLNAMLACKEKGKLGRVEKTNFELYSKVCTEFYEETTRLLGHPAQSQTLEL